MTGIALPVVSNRPLWRAAQGAGLLLTVVLLIALVRAPELTLRILWDMVIPVLPAVFMLNPLIWRNVCPLGTLNEITGSAPGRPPLNSRFAHVGWIVGIALLYLLVPARRFLFNENGVALAVTIAVVALLALLAGLAVGRRAGFCNSICPVLPVEKLYGQFPLLHVRGARCSTCTVCLPAGCIDLAGQKTVPQTIGPGRRDTAWIRSSFGVFAAAFPGFILAYFTVENGPLATAPLVYAQVVGYATASLLVVWVAVAVLQLNAWRAIPALGAVSLALYYWFASSTLSESYHLTEAATPVLRLLFGTTIAWWFFTRGSRNGALRSDIKAA